MNKLGLDFVRRPGSPWPGRVLLVLALGFSVETALSYKNLRDAVALDEAALGRTQPRAAPGRKVPAEELAAVRETVERLGMPWSRLFGALESAASDQVALLGIEPDPKAGTVLVSGEAGDFPAVLEYVAGLQRAKTLGRVHLVRHEVRQNERERPVAFTVSASWSEVKQ